MPCLRSDPILSSSSGNLSGSSKAVNLRMPKERSMGLLREEAMGLPRIFKSDFLWGYPHPKYECLVGGMIPCLSELLICLWNMLPKQSHVVREWKQVRQVLHSCHVELVINSCFHRSALRLLRQFLLSSQSPFCYHIGRTRWLKPLGQYPLHKLPW